MNRLHSLIFISIISIIIAVMYFTDPLSELLNNDQIHHEDSTLGISFIYPGSLKLISKENSINLYHQIKFENSGDCDMTEEGKKYEYLTDFDLTISITNKDIVSSMKEFSPYIPEENFIIGKVQPSPGFIDEYSNGKYAGYSIYEGAEGCGHTIYYLSITPQKTLVVKNKSIQILSSARTGPEKEKALLTTGIITPEVNSYYFDYIMKSLSVR